MVQKFRIPKIQFPDDTKPKDKEDQNVDPSVLLRNSNKKKRVDRKKYRDKVWSRD